MFLLVIRSTNLNILKYDVELYQSSFIFLWMSYCYAPFLTYCHTHASLSQWRRIRYVMWAFKWIWHCFRIAQDKLKRKKFQETLFWNIFIYLTHFIEICFGRVFKLNDIPTNWKKNWWAVKKNHSVRKKLYNSHIFQNQYNSLKYTTKRSSLKITINNGLTGYRKYERLTLMNGLPSVLNILQN